MNKEIIINGNPRPVHYGIRMIQEVLKTMNKEMGDLLEEQPEIGLDLILDVSATALSEGARRAGMSERYSSDDVADLIDDDESGELLGTLTEFFAESISVNINKLGRMGNALAGKNSKKLPTHPNPPTPPKPKSAKK